MTAESTYIFELPSGTRIKVLEVSILDAWYNSRAMIEGKTFIATDIKNGRSMYFMNEEDGIEYCFFAETTYQII